MNEYLRQALIVIGCAPVAYFILKMIFKNSIMFTFSFYVILYVLYVTYMSVLIGKIGGYTMFWITPLNFLVGALVFMYINKVLRKPLDKSILQVKELSLGNLGIDVKESASKDELGVLNNSLFNLINTFKEIINNINANALNLAQVSQQMSSSSQQLSQGANEQASSIEEISSTIEEISANILQNTENAQQTEQVSIEANKSFMGVHEKAKGANEANQDIASNITIINDIAFQTNILALNAAVEAARAGENGRGFAVVASEVRKLAEKSKMAAERIIAMSQTSLKMGKDASVLMLDTIPKINKTVKLVQEISAASKEQNSGITQVDGAIQQLNSITQQNASSSDELAATAEELAGQAEQLKELISFFKIGENSNFRTNKYHGGLNKNGVSNKTPGYKAEKIRNLAKFKNIESDDQFTQF